MAMLSLWSEYSREDVHSIFSPNTTFTPQAGTWGLQGIVRIPEREGDWVFFVTFGQHQGDHAFDESITDEGVLSWQSQPSQRLDDKVIRALVAHDEQVNTIHLFLRTNRRSHYAYLGRLAYLTHDRNREAPVYFQWQLIDWPAPADALSRMGLTLLGSGQNEVKSLNEILTNSLSIVERPAGRKTREGVGTQDFKSRKSPNYAERDHNNRQLGLKGELLVLEQERRTLSLAGRADLAEKVRHVSFLEGDGAGYDIQSFFSDGQLRFVEVKTTKGPATTPFYISPNEIAFSETHAPNFCLIRVFEFDGERNAGKAFVISGDLRKSLDLTPTEFRAVLTFET
jgi:hypothetical protein